MKKPTNLLNSADTAKLDAVGAAAPYGANMPNPTRVTYRTLEAVYAYFNRELFGDRLPHCLITLQHSRKACGFFDHRRFGARDRSHKADEMGLSTRYWTPERADIDNLSTMLHEMVHCRQAHFGKPGRGDYHNREWARMMIEIGLVPSSTGEPGGKTTGRRVSHYIRENGPFDRAYAKLAAAGFQIPYEEIRETGEAAALAGRRRKSRAASKSAYGCQGCEPPVTVWGRPRLRLACGFCTTEFVAAWVAKDSDDV